MFAVAAIMAPGSAIQGGGQDCRPADGDPSIGPPFFDCSLEQPFAAGHTHRGQELTVGQLWQLLVSARDSDELLDPVIIRGQVVVTYRPVVAITIAAGGLELIIGQAIGLAPPHDRAAPNLAASNPLEWFSAGSCVRIVDVVDKKLVAVLVASVAFGLDRLPLAV